MGSQDRDSIKIESDKPGKGLYQYNVDQWSGRPEWPPRPSQAGVNTLCQTGFFAPNNSSLEFLKYSAFFLPLAQSCITFTLLFSYLHEQTHSSPHHRISSYLNRKLFVGLLLRSALNPRSFTSSIYSTVLMHSAQCPPFSGFDAESTRRSYSVSEGTFPSSPAASFLSAFACPSAIPEVEEDAEGSVISGYTLGRIVGHGAFSTIRLASSSSSNGVVAVKIVQHSNAQHAQSTTESTIWSDLCHEHLLPLFSFTTTHHATYHFTLYCPAGSLLDIMNRHAPSRIIPQDDAGTMFRQVVRGLRYLHEVAGYIHGDMKLDNVLVDEMGVCRITDFGLAKEILRSSQCESTEPSDEESELDDDVFHPTVPASTKMGTHHLSLMRKRGRGLAPRPHRSTTTVTDSPSTLATDFPAGSLAYAAPELLAPSHFQPNSQPRFADPAQDMWALGVMLFALFTGKLPFVDPFEPRLIMKILRGK